jgi:hypothetical protein
MKRLFGRLLAVLALGSVETTSQAGQTIDPSTILFSMSTISDDSAPLEMSGPVSPTDVVFHEDEWRQVEFFPRSRLAEVQNNLKELKSFAQAHKRGIGWSKIYVRKIKPAAVVSGTGALGKLERQLGVHALAGPVLFAGSRNILGRVANGFALPLGGKVSLYGFQDSTGIPVLGANIAAGGNDQILTRAFSTVSTGERVILVDWRAQMVLISVTPDGQIEAWRP